jgi:O-methyltransferase
VAADPVGSKWADSEARFSERAKARPTRSLRDAFDLLTLPLLVHWIFDEERIHPAYGMTRARLYRLALKVYRNTQAIPTGTSYRAHLAMAAKIFETPPTVKGAIVECGCWVGGSTANLSLIADIVDRDLIVYDSFEGLPKADLRDKRARAETEGYFRGELEVVTENVRRHGVIDRVQFRKGWFDATLPRHREPIVFCFIDVDYEASLHDCIVNLWPHLTAKGHVFIDEYVQLDYCALFFSERFWKTYFDSQPPGLQGVGTGIGLGQYFIGPFSLKVRPRSTAYTRKDFHGHWDYVRDE